MYGFEQRNAGKVINLFAGFVFTLNQVRPKNFILTGSAHVVRAQTAEKRFFLSVGSQSKQAEIFQPFPKRS